MINKNPVFIISARIGLTAGLLISLIRFISYVVGDMNNSVGQTIGLILWIGAMALAIRKYRTDIGKGLIEFGRAFGVGVLTVSIISFIVSLYLFLWLSLDPGAGDALLNLVKTGAEESGRTEQFEIILPLYEMIFSNPALLAFGTMFSNVFMGTLGSLILAAILKKTESTLQKID